MRRPRALPLATAPRPSRTGEAVVCWALIGGTGWGPQPAFNEAAEPLSRRPETSVDASATVWEGRWVSIAVFREQREVRS